MTILFTFSCASQARGHAYKL